MLVRGGLADFQHYGPRTEAEHDVEPSVGSSEQRDNERRLREQHDTDDEHLVLPRASGQQQGGAHACQICVPKCGRPEEG